MKIYNLIRAINRVTVAACKLILIVMMLLITVNAAGRYLFNNPVPGSFAFTEEYLMVGLIFLSIGYVQSIDGNVTVEVIAESRIPMPTRRAIKIVFYFLTFLIFAVITYLTGETAWDLIQSGARLSGIVRLPTGPSWAAVAFGCAYFCLIVILQIRHEIKMLLAHGGGTEFEEHFMLSETEDMEDLEMRE